jgi:hypothetical protein
MGGVKREDRSGDRYSEQCELAGVESVPASLGALMGLHAFSADLPGILRVALHSLLLPDSLKALSQDPEADVSPSSPALITYCTEFGFSHHLRHSKPIPYCRMMMRLWMVKVQPNWLVAWTPSYLLVYRRTWPLP